MAHHRIDHKAVAIAIGVKLQESPGSLREGSEARVQFFKDLGLSMEKGNKIMAQIEQGLKMKSTVPRTPTHYSLSKPSGRAQQNHGQMTPVSSYSHATESVMSGNSTDFVAAQVPVDRTPRPQTSASKQSPGSDLTFEQYNKLRIPQGYSRKLAVIKTVSLSMFPYELQQQASNWRVGESGPLGMIDKIYNAIKIHEGNVKQRMARIRTLEDDYAKLQNDLVVAQTKADDITARNSDLAKEMKDAQNKLETKCNEADRLVQCLDTTTTDVVALKAQQAHTEDLLNAKTSELQSALQVKSDLESQLQEMKIRLERNMEELEINRKASDQYANEANTLREQLSKTILESRSKSTARESNLLQIARQELMNDISFRNEIRSSIAAEQTLVEELALQALLEKRKNAAAKGRHTRSCANRACTESACIKKRADRRASIKRTLRSSRGDSSRLTMEQQTSLPNELVCLLDGPYW